MERKYLTEENLRKIREGLNALVEVSHGVAVDGGWWTDLETGERKKRDILGLMMLSVTEIAEAAEGYRKDLMDDHLPQHKMMPVECGDCLIRLGDLLGSENVSNFGDIVVDKIMYNINREDHRIENRKKEGGKKY